MESGAVPHRRRVRYAGTHPRNFREKYKELNANLHSDEILHILSRGKTPAGMHIPICVREVLVALSLKPGMVGLDATLGFGGHAREILRGIAPGGKLYATDVDPVELPKTEARMRAEGFDENCLVIRRMNFAGLPKMVADAGRPFDFVLADLGVSSMQIDNPDRGFTFKKDGPLDCRMNPTRGQPVSEYIKTLSMEELQVLLVENADEPHSLALAEAIYHQRGSLETTSQLSRVIEQALSGSFDRDGGQQIKKSTQRVFQALRIAVNDELSTLTQFLARLPQSLSSGGRVAILSFHSGEDRRVKKAFLQGHRNGDYSRISPDPVRPSPEERRSNPRSSCAKLRWASVS